MVVTQLLEPLLLIYYCVTIIVNHLDNNIIILCSYWYNMYYYQAFTQCMWIRIIAQSGSNIPNRYLIIFKCCSSCMHLIAIVYTITFIALLCPDLEQLPTHVRTYVLMVASPHQYLWHYALNSVYVVQPYIQWNTNDSNAPASCRNSLCAYDIIHSESPCTRLCLWNYYYYVYTLYSLEYLMPYLTIKF